MVKKSDKSKSRAPRSDWRTVDAASESLRFVETAGFVSLEECEQELLDPANPPPIFMKDVMGGDADDDCGGSSQLQQAQAEVDRLMRMHGARPDGEAVAVEDAEANPPFKAHRDKAAKRASEAVAKRAAEDAEATRIPPPAKAKLNKAAKRKRAETEQGAEGAPNSDDGIAEADGAGDGDGDDDGDSVAAPARKKRTRQKKKKKKKAVNKAAAEASGGEAAGGKALAAGGVMAGLTAPDAAARERGGASVRELSESERAAASLNWERLGLHPSLVHGLVAQGFGAPTPIQEAALPPALHGMRDLVGAAQTGSGKTLAFGLPILHRLVEEAEAEAAEAAAVAAAEAGPAAAGEAELAAEGGSAAGEGAAATGTKLSGAAHPSGASRGLRGGWLFALIMTPTRELAAQVTAHLQAVAASCPLLGKDCIISLVGGLSLDKQRRQLASRPRVVVATPGRLWELLREGSTHLQALPGIRFFVLDEVDRMIEAGHFQELSRILEMLDQPPPTHSQHSSQLGPSGDSQLQDSQLQESQQLHSQLAPAGGPSMPNPPVRRRQTFLMSATLMLPPAAREAHAKKVKNHQPVPQVRSGRGLKPPNHALPKLNHPPPPAHPKPTLSSPHAKIVRKHLPVPQVRSAPNARLRPVLLPFLDHPTHTPNSCFPAHAPTRVAHPDHPQPAPQPSFPSFRPTLCPPFRPTISSSPLAAHLTDTRMCTLKSTNPTPFANPSTCRSGLSSTSFRPSPTPPYPHPTRTLPTFASPCPGLNHRHADAHAQVSQPGQGS
jgi:hypothetical protein